MNWGNFFKNEAIGIGLGAAEGLTGVDAVGLYKKYRSKKSLPHVDSSAVRHMGNDEPIEAPTTQPMTGIVPRPMDQMYPTPPPYPGLTNPYAIRPRMMAKGGKAKPGELIRVGDATGDPNAMEDVYVHPDGSGVTVRPLVAPMSEQINGRSVAQTIDPTMGTGISPDIINRIKQARGISPNVVSPVLRGDVPPTPVAEEPMTGEMVQNSIPTVAPQSSELPSTDSSSLAVVKPSLADQREKLLTDGAPHDRLWKRLLIGALTGLGAGGPGGAIGGALVGAIDKRGYNTRKTEQELAKLNRRIAVDAQLRKYQSDADKAGADYQHQLIQNQLGLDEHQYNTLAHDPQWLIAQQTKQITPQQAEYLSNLIGKPVTPAMWQTMVEKTDPGTGKSLIRPEYDPRYSVNPTVSPDRTVPPVPIKAAGIPLVVKQPDVLNAVAAQDRTNAQLRQQTIIHNSSQAFAAAKANLDARQQYNGQVLKNRADVLTQHGANIQNLGELQGLQNQLQSAGNAMQTVGSTIRFDANGAPIDDKGNQDALKRFEDAQKDFAAIQAKFDAALGKTKAGQEVLTQLQGLEIQKPGSVSAVPVAPVTVNTVTPGKIASKATVKAYAKQKGISYSDAVKKAQAEGYTVQ